VLPGEYEYMVSSYKIHENNLNDVRLIIGRRKKSMFVVGVV
jgi:hypothetical protein